MGCEHVCGEEEAPVHPAVCSRLILYGVNFHMPFLISGPGYTEQEISPFTLLPDHKHHACHQSMPNNLERRVEVRELESTETVCGDSVQTSGTQYGGEKP